MDSKFLLIIYRKSIFGDHHTYSSSVFQKFDNLAYNELTEKMLYTYSSNKWIKEHYDSHFYEIHAYQDGKLIYDSTQNIDLLKINDELNINIIKNQFKYTLQIGENKPIFVSYTYRNGIFRFTLKDTKKECLPQTNNKLNTLIIRKYDGLGSLLTTETFANTSFIKADKTIYSDGRINITWEFSGMKWNTLT